MKSGIIHPLKSELSSPLHPVSKTSNTWRACVRACVYYRALNAVIKLDRYLVPHIQNIAAVAMNNRILTKFDLIRAYHQIPVEVEHIPKTAIVTPFGLFEFLHVPFSLRNAALSFQRFKDRVLQDLPFVCAEQEHISHVRQVFECFQQYGVVINLLKCVYGQSEVTFLGHHISAEGKKLKVLRISQSLINNCVHS